MVVVVILIDFFLKKCAVIKITVISFSANSY